MTDDDEYFGRSFLDVFGDGDFVDEVRQRSDERGNGQMLSCLGHSGEDCGSRRFGVSLLARVGASDDIGIYCAKCGLPAMDAELNDVADDIAEQIASIRGGGR